MAANAGYTKNAFAGRYLLSQKRFILVFRRPFRSGIGSDLSFFVYAAKVSVMCERYFSATLLTTEGSSGLSSPTADTTSPSL